MADVQSNIKVSIDTTEALASIKNLQRQISAFHTSMAKGGAAANAVTSQMQQNLINSVNATGKFSAQMRTIKTTTESFTSSLEKNKFSMGEYFRYAGGASKSFGRLFKTEFETINKVARENVKDLQTQYIKMGRDANGAMKAIAVRPLSLDMNNLATKTMVAAQKQAILNQLLKQGSTNLLNFGKNTQWAGRQLMVGFTIPLMALGAAASKTFMDMETQAIRFKKVYGDLFTSTTESTAALDAIKNLGKEFTKYGIAVADTVGLASEAAAAGFKGLDLQRQTAAATRLSILGQVESQKALETTIALQNAFSMSSEDLAKNIDFLNAVENQTVLSLDDMSTAIPKAAPVIQQLGGDVKDLAFFMAAMKEGGINASEGANALKSGLAAMINPTGKASAMLEGFGINIKKIVVDNKGDLKKTVTDFATALNKLDPLNRAQAIEQMFGKFQFARLSTLFANVTKEGTQAARVLDLAGASIQELAALSEKELGQTSESAMNKFKSSIEQLKLSLVPLGEQFLKVITPIAEFITKVLDKFNSLGDGTKKIIVVLTAVVAGLGPVLLMTFGLLMNGLANIIKGFTFLKSIFNKAGRATGVLGTEVKYMTTEQRNAAAVASSLDQVHRNLAQTFSSEAAAVDALTRAYYRAVAAQSQFMPIRVPLQRGSVTKRAKGKPARVGGTGNQDTELALLMPGETVIPTKMSKKYGGLINGMIADNIPGYKKGRGISFGGQTFDIPVSSNEQLLQEALGRFSKDLGGVTGVLSELEKKAKLAGDSFKHISADALKEALDAQGVPRNNPKGTSATLYDGEKYVAAHLKPQNAEITDPKIINALADATSSKSLARDLRATAAKGGKVQQLSSFVAELPESANKRTPGGNFEMGREQMASLFTGPKAERTLSPIYHAWAETNGLTLKSVLKDPKLTKEMHASVAKFGTLVGDEISKLPESFGEKDLYNAVDKAVARIDKQDKKLAKTISNMQKTSMLAVDNSVSGKALERRTAGKRDVGLRTALGTPINLTNYKDIGNEKFLTTGDRVAAEVGAKDAKAYSNAVKKNTEDIYVKSRKRNSPHPLAPKDGKDDARAYNRAVDKELTRGGKKRRVAFRPQGPAPIIPPIIPPVIPPIIPSGYVPPEGPMYGPRTPTKYDKTVGKVAGKFRSSKIASLPKSGMGMGLSSALMMGSYMIPGKTGDIIQKVSMVAFSLSALQPVVSTLILAFGTAAVAIGAAVAAAVVGIGLALYLFNKSAKKSAEDIKEAAKRESEARIGSARAVEQFAKTFNKALPSEREFSRSNSKKIKASGGLVDQYAKDYATEGNISTGIINQAAKKGQVEGINAIAIDVANKAAILGLSPEEIAAMIKAASRLIGADEVSVTAKIQKLLAPGGKDILKEPLTIDARLNYLNKQSAPIIKNLDKSINEISKIQFDQVNPLPGAESFNYKSLQSAAGEWSSIKNSWKGDFWDKALAAGKVWTMFQKHTIKSVITPSPFGSAKNLVLDFKAPSAVESYNDVQTRIQDASTKVSIAFMQQKEALALLDAQYADGQISQEEYNRQKQISRNNIDSLEKSSIKLVKQLNKIDTSGDSAAGVIKDLANQSLAVLKAANPDKFNEITKAISALPDDAEVGIYMGYTRGSLTLMDLAILPQLLQQIQGQEYTVAINLIMGSGLSEGGEARFAKQVAEAKLRYYQQIAASLPGPDRDIIKAISYYQSQITEYDRIITKIENGIEQKGKLDTDLNEYQDLTEGSTAASNAYVDILQKEIDALKAKRDAQKDANDEVQREIDLKMKLQDLANQAVEAKISGNYLKAATLAQEAQNIQMKYNQETELKKKDDEIARLEARLREIENGSVLTKAESAKLKAAKKVKLANGGAVKGFNTGGNVRGAGTATSDSIPAMLSNGEYVIKADSVKKYGTETFDALNAGKYADGGIIQGFRTGGLNRIAKSGISSIGKMISSRLSGSRSAVPSRVLNTREQWLKDMSDLVSEEVALDKAIKLKESSNYETMVFPKILDHLDLQEFGDPRTRSLNIVTAVEDLTTGNKGYFKALEEVTPDEVRREVFGSLLARRAGLLAPENIPVTTGYEAPHQLGVFSRSLQEMSPGSISERRLSEKLKLSQSKAYDDKNSSLPAKIYASLGMTSERSTRNAILDSMGFVDNHGGNLYINPMQKQSGAIDFGRIGESPYSISKFAASDSLDQLKNKYYRQYVELPESERSAFLEGLRKAKETLSSIKNSEIEEMLLASGYSKSDMPLSLYRTYIDNTIKALQDRLTAKKIAGWDEILPRIPIDENWYKETPFTPTLAANGGAVKGFRTGGLNRVVSGFAKKIAFSIPNKINEIKNYLKVRSMIKDGMWHGSQPTGGRGEEYLQGKNVLEGAETYDPHYGMGFFGTSSKSEADMYAAGYNSSTNWGEAFGSVNKITKAPFGKYVDFTRGTNSIKWQNYKLYQALGMEKDGYLNSYLPENLGDIMAGQNVTGSIMKRISDGQVPGDMGSAKWLAWSKPAGVHTEEYTGGRYAPKKPASLLDNLKSKFSLLNKPKGYNTGGHILGAGTATSDSIPAMLSDGEYVIKASSVKKYGTDTFDALNAQRFSEGSPGGVKPMTGRRSFKLGALSGGTWQAMEEVEKLLLLKYGSNRNSNIFAKLGTAFGRLGFNALQGAASGISTGKNPLSALIGTAYGLGEGLVGLAQSGSDYGVKGGTYSNVKGFNPENELKKINPKDSGLRILESAGFGGAFGLGLNKLGQLAKWAAPKLGIKVPESIQNRFGPMIQSLRPTIEELSQPFSNPFKKNPTAKPSIDPVAKTPSLIKSAAKRAAQQTPTFGQELLQSGFWNTLGKIKGVNTHKLHQKIPKPSTIYYGKKAYDYSFKHGKSFYDNIVDTQYRRDKFAEESDPENFLASMGVTSKFYYGSEAYGELLGLIAKSANDKILKPLVTNPIKRGTRLIKGEYQYSKNLVSNMKNHLSKEGLDDFLYRYTPVGSIKSLRAAKNIDITDGEGDWAWSRSVSEIPKKYDPSLRNLFTMPTFHGGALPDNLLNRLTPGEIKHLQGNIMNFDLFTTVDKTKALSYATGKNTTHAGVALQQTIWNKPKSLSKIWDMRGGRKSLWSQNKKGYAALEDYYINVLGRPKAKAREQLTGERVPGIAMTLKSKYRAKDRIEGLTNIQLNEAFSKMGKKSPKWVIDTIAHAGGATLGGSHHSVLTTLDPEKRIKEIINLLPKDILKLANTSSYIGEDLTHHVMKESNEELMNSILERFIHQYQKYGKIFPLLGEGNLTPGHKRKPSTFAASGGLITQNGLINQKAISARYDLPSFATGIDYLPNDMIAQLHQGERVLTKEENKTYSSSAPTTNIININGSDLNKKEIAQAVMVELDRAKNKNNKTNMVGR